ncbi:MAG: hypothetical protein ABJC61_07410, partial [Acidobacteriota bacterium]
IPTHTLAAIEAGAPVTVLTTGMTPMTSKMRLSPILKSTAVVAGLGAPVTADDRANVVAEADAAKPGSRGPRGR